MGSQRVGHDWETSFHFTPHHIFHFHFADEKNWGLKKSSNLPKVSHLIWIKSRRKKRPQTTELANKQAGKILPHFKSHAYVHHVTLPVQSDYMPTFRSSSLLASKTLVRRGKLAGQKLRYNDCRSSTLFLPLDLMPGSWPLVRPQESRQGSCALLTLFSSTSMSCHSPQFLQKNSRIRNGTLGPNAVYLTPGFRPPGIRGWG